MKKIKKTDAAKEKVLKLLAFSREKQARDPVILDIRGLSSLCDYFLICSGETGRQVQAIADNIVDRCRAEKIALHHAEADENNDWVLIDLYDVFVHIFTDTTRHFYNLEYLWREAKTVSASVVTKAKARTKTKTKKSSAKRATKRSTRK